MADAWKFSRAKIMATTNAIALRNIHAGALRRVHDAREMGWMALEQSWAIDLAFVERRMAALHIPIKGPKRLHEFVAKEAA